jgi:hypothetical protein
MMPPEKSRALAINERDGPPVSGWWTVKARLFGVSGCQSDYPASPKLSVSLVGFEPSCTGCVEEEFCELRLYGVLTASFSEHDPHRMMHIRGLLKGSVRLAEVASSCGRVSIYATRCERFAERAGPPFARHRVV